MNNLFYILNILFFLNSITNVSTIYLGSEQVQQCVGKHQIPFDNIFGLNVVGYIAEPLNLNNFDVLPIETIMENNDYTILLNMKYNSSIPTISLGASTGLGTYRFEFMYFQWFEKSSTSQPIELHFVFYNSRVKNFQQALKSKNNIMVLAFNIKKTFSGKTENTTLLKHLERVRSGLTQANIENVPLYSWMPDHLKEYFLYEGYLTFFNCKTQVLWMDFFDTINFEPEVIREFELLQTSGGAALMKQYKTFRAPNEPFVTNAVSAIDNNLGIPFVNDFDFADQVAFNGASIQTSKVLNLVAVIMIFFRYLLKFY